MLRREAFLGRSGHVRLAQGSMNHAGQVARRSVGVNLEQRAQHHLDVSVRHAVLRQIVGT